jgi:glycosyltransferase involved in cell wall biosynthesis
VSSGAPVGATAGVTRRRPRPLRIGLLGNICNNLYQIGKALRSDPGFDVRLFLDERADPQESPESDDPELAIRPADWIERLPILWPRTMIAPWTSAVVRRLRTRDLLIASGTGPMFAQFAGRPYAFLVSGGDLTILPFADRALLFGRRTVRARTAAAATAWWQRRAIRRATEIWSQPFAPFVTALQTLRVSRERIATEYFPVVADTERLANGNGDHAEADAWVGEIRRRFDFTVFHPSRLMMNDAPTLRLTGQWKGNDALFRGFAEFVRRSGASRAGLVLIERSVSPDIERARAILHELGVAGQVLWLKPPRPFGFTRTELVPLYAAADVVADDFGIGWFGSVVLEGLALGRPVLCFVDEDAMRQLYPWHPLLSTRDPGEIATLLHELYREPSRRDELGRRGRRWVEEFHAPAAVGRTYRERMRKLGERLLGGAFASSGR